MSARRWSYPLVIVAAALAAGCATPAPRGPGEAAPGPAESAANSPPGRLTPRPVPPPKAETENGYVFPVRGHASYGRTHGGYPAVDIFAACGLPVVAVTGGTVLEVSRVDRYRKDGPQGPENGGLSVSIMGDDGVRYYGSHLSVVTTGIEAGVRVKPGQRLGSLGRTGNANDVCHLHFGLSAKCAGTGDWWVRRGTIWPAPYLDAWRKARPKSAAADVTAAGCPRKP